MRIAATVVLAALAGGCDRSPDPPGPVAASPPPPDYAACIRAVAGMNPDEQARAAIRSGDDSYYWIYASEGELDHPPGITQCGPASPTIVRRGKVNAFDRDQESVSGLHARCLTAISEYKVRFNWAITRRHPANLTKYCANGIAKIDRRYILSDGTRFRQFDRALGR